MPPADPHELLLGADDMAAPLDPASPLATRRRPLVSGEAEAAPRLSGGGSTLFERMANLSRGTVRPEGEGDDGGDPGDGQSISIPRFLGRQNNQ